MSEYEDYEDDVHALENKGDENVDGRRNRGRGLLVSV